MVCPFKRPSFLLQVLNLDLGRCGCVFKMADDPFQWHMLRFVLTEVECFFSSSEAKPRWHIRVEEQ